MHWNVMHRRALRLAAIIVLLTTLLLTTLLSTTLLADHAFAHQPRQEPNTPTQGSTIYLPFVETRPGAPDVRIIAPAVGAKISGMHFFAVQAVDPATVRAVTFKADDQILVTDDTANDGLRVLFDASSFGDGPLVLAAEATGPGGAVTRWITVTVVADPPSSAVIGPEGGLLQTATGSIVAVPPGALTQSALLTVTERTQAQVTSENGIDWEQLGITFLGDQQISGSAAISLPLQVNSAGYGNRVQPGQAVVNYTLLPDVNGDGVDELVVINTATVAPNNAVVSDPVPQILVKSLQVDSTAEQSQRVRAEGISGRIGSSVRIRMDDMNQASLLGNLGTWRSLVDGTTIQQRGRVLPDPADLSQQIFSSIIPPLPGRRRTTTAKPHHSGHFRSNHRIDTAVSTADGASERDHRQIYHRHNRALASGPRLRRGGSGGDEHRVGPDPQCAGTLRRCARRRSQRAGRADPRRHRHHASEFALLPCASGG
ncbi:MAG: hypothetical protein R2856_17800 [Caldilineaceae bacterium]